MKLLYIQKILIFTLAFFLSACKNISCVEEVSKISSSESLKILNWNAQTFFDSVTDGSEYSEFIKSKSWCREFYVERLNRMVKVLKSCDADVIALEEIENEGVMHDIYNFLGSEWNFKKNYLYAAFSRDRDSSIGCGIISRYPLKEMTVHSVDIKNNVQEMPSLRPVSQLSVCKNDRELVLLVNHWKSKAGGEEESELWRNWQEKVLSSLVKKLEAEEKKVLCLGDFNRDIDDFYKKENGFFVLRDSLVTLEGDFSLNEGSVIYSAWYGDYKREDFSDRGSYFFNGKWEKIDNFFAGQGVSFLDFEVLDKGEWCNAESGTPYKYHLWDGNGYSDHLAILCTVNF